MSNKLKMAILFTSWARNKMYMIDRDETFTFTAMNCTIMKQNI